MKAEKSFFLFASVGLVVAPVPVSKNTVDGTISALRAFGSEETTPLLGKQMSTSFDVSHPFPLTESDGHEALHLESSKPAELKAVEQKSTGGKAEAPSAKSAGVATEELDVGNAENVPLAEFLASHDLQLVKISYINLIIPTSHQVQGSYIVPRGWSFTASKLKTPLPPGFTQLAETGDVLPPSFTLLKAGDIDVVVPPGWKEGGINAVIVPEDWPISMTPQGPMSIPPPRHWPNKGKFPRSWRQDKKTKKFYPPEWRVVDTRPTQTFLYPTEHLKREETNTGSKVLVPYTWTFEDMNDLKGKIIPPGMKSTYSYVIPVDWHFDPRSGKILPNTISLSTVLELDSRGLVSESLLDAYLSSSLEKAVEMTEKQVLFIKQQAEIGKTRYQVGLAGLYMYGRGGLDKNPHQAMKYFKLAAEKDDAIAQAWYGYLLDTSKTQGSPLAFSMMEKSAGNELPRAKYLLGLMYAEGRWIKKNPDRAERLIYNAASEGGLGIANYYLSENYKFVMKAAYAKDAALQGIPAAQNFLGFMYASGYYVTQDYDLAVHWLKKASASGDKPAALNLKFLQKNGYLDRFQQDYAESQRDWKHFWVHFFSI